MYNSCLRRYIEHNTFLYIYRVTWNAVRSVRLLPQQHLTCQRVYRTAWSIATGRCSHRHYSAQLSAAGTLRRFWLVRSGEPWSSLGFGCTYKSTRPERSFYIHRIRLISHQQSHYQVTLPCLDEENPAKPAPRPNPGLLVLDCSFP